MNVRCIKAINGVALNAIINIPTEGYAFAHRGESGGLVIRDLGEGEIILFVVDDAVDSIGDKISIKAPDSMANYFSFDLDIPDPDEPDPVVYPLTCSLTQLLSSIPPTAVLITATNEWELTLVPIAPHIILEKATEPNDITKAGAAIINITYRSMTKDANGNYKVRIRNTDVAETVLLRQVGCASTNISPTSNDFFGGRFHAYNPTSEVIDPPTTPVSGKINTLIGAFRWDGFYDDYGLTPRQGIDGHTYDNGINHTTGIRVDLTEFSSANVVPFYGEQGLSPETVTIEKNGRWVCTAYDGSGNCTAGENQYDYVSKNVTCKFNLTTTAMDKEIGYAKDAGIDYWLFLWHSPYDTPMAEAMHKFRLASDKQGLKMAIKLGGSFGWDIGKSVAYIVSCMKSDYYQKVNNKPLLFVETGFSASYLASIVASYSDGGISQIYIVATGGYGAYPSTPYQASTVYITAPPRAAPNNSLSELPHSTIMDAEVSLRNAFMNNAANNNTAIVPLLTTGALNYPKRSSLNAVSVEYWHAKASNSEWDTKFASLMQFIDAYPNRVPTILFYSWNENHESGNPICPTLASGTNSVVVANINTAGATTGVNRSTLDKIKQYCKK